MHDVGFPDLSGVGGDIASPLYISGETLSGGKTLGSLLIRSALA